MKIGIDCRTILNPNGGERAGVGHYTYYLVKNLLKIDKTNDYVLFMDHRARGIRDFDQKNVKLKFFKFSEYKKYLPFYYSHLAIAKDIKQEELDVLHAPANVIPMKYNGPTVLTIHDMAIYKHPSWFPAGQKFSVNVLVPSSIKRAKKVIAVSQSTKKSIVTLMKTDPKKISVVYEAGEKSKQPTNKAINKTLKKFKLNENYIFSMGTLEVRKNVTRLIKAWEKICLKDPKKMAGWQLAIAGGKGYKFADVFKTIKTSKIGHKIRYIGYVSHEEKYALLKQAAVFAFPSLWEGFGLPVLEAMNTGTPVLTSRISSLPEVAGKAAVLVNPNKIDDISKGLEKLLKNKTTRTKYSKLGTTQTKKFTWQKTAQETLKIYLEVAKS